MNDTTQMTRPIPRCGHSDFGECTPCERDRLKARIEEADRRIAAMEATIASYEASRAYWSRQPTNLHQPSTLNLLGLPEQRPTLAEALASIAADAQRRASDFTIPHAVTATEPTK